MPLPRIISGQLVAVVLLLGLTAALARVDPWAHKRPANATYGGRQNSSHHHYAAPNYNGPHNGGFAFPNRTASGWGAPNHGGLAKIPLQMPGQYGGVRNATYAPAGFNYHNATRPQAPSAHPYGSLFH